MNINDKIPQGLIARAAEAGACREAIDWLNAAPRTWLDLSKDSSAWCDWAVYNMATAPAREAYNMATAPAREAYNKAKAPARKAYEDARAKARKAYEDARAKALYAALTVASDPIEEEEKQARSDQATLEAYERGRQAEAEGRDEQL